jgi:hypothetical protein
MTDWFYLSHFIDFQDVAEGDRDADRYRNSCTRKRCGECFQSWDPLKRGEVLRYSPLREILNMGELWDTYRTLKHRGDKKMLTNMFKNLRKKKWKYYQSRMSYKEGI